MVRVVGSKEGHAEWVARALLKEASRWGGVVLPVACVLSSNQFLSCSVSRDTDAQAISDFGPG